MELVLNNLISDKLSKEEKESGLDFLQGILQSDTKDYETYFSSRAAPGSITEDIAEIDAELSALDRKIRKSLLENKSQVIKDILGNDDRVQLDEMSKSLEELWELDTSISKNTEDDTTNKDQQTNEVVSLDDFLEHNNEHNDTNNDGDNPARKKKEDEFHKALNRLRNRLSTKGDDKDEIRSDTLVIVLENLDSITDLMELPFLARTCIRTGHYQEAVMLYTHTISLRSRFPGSTIVDEICENVLNEISTTMLTGLVKLLSTNVSVNSLKKILKYLNSIPPFDGETNKALLSIFLAIRYKFITDEIASYSLDIESSNESLIEMMIKRKIEVLREHVYMSLNVFIKTFMYDTSDLEIPFPIELGTSALQPYGSEKDEKDEEEVEVKVVEKAEGQLEEVKVQEQEEERERETEEEGKSGAMAAPDESSANTPSFRKESKIPTNALMLQFVDKCVTYILNDLTRGSSDVKLSDSVCLQLVYCSFRLSDLNRNYHHLFLNRINETSLFTTEQLAQAIDKRAELASKYVYS
ncbi:hypothetical protein SEUBUCD646_0M00760 [Saccharomyces eubayanus]|uniref:Conserved oligomeric Golgi complex subunit 8 n=2 Tax=Saccharomyces TaxID=4930 RepID=A0A6C1ECV3_SACPS|nr:conserved oligomeric Golgi complex component [Saccharomyces pastorianus]CAI1618659.1 hypothetical protein SEUBUCD650_0M00750 [Saccharomyces eubayanus]CAI1646117.1 hypothetical protein SEUBUCD646_0M00760 [Saccharomyces eubayanus]